MSEAEDDKSGSDVVGGEAPGVKIIPSIAISLKGRKPVVIPNNLVVEDWVFVVLLHEKCASYKQLYSFNLR